MDKHKILNFDFQKLIFFFILSFEKKNIIILILFPLAHQYIVIVICSTHKLESFLFFFILHFSDCPQLESFPKGGLPSNLRRLRIEGCLKLVASREEWGLFKLHSLKELNLSDDFENVESFPVERLLPPTLSDLNLTECSKLTTTNSRGFLHLKYLKSFYILWCPRLKCLPEEGLPESLSALCIHDCPLLEQRYQKNGEHWRKIQHIPSVMISCT